MDTPEPNVSGAADPDGEIRLGPIVRFGVALLVVTALSMALMLWLFRVLDAREKDADPGRHPTARRQPVIPAPPEPRLDVDEARTLAKVRTAEDMLLHGYDWIDRERQLVRIPIARAIELVAERGLPARPAPPSRGAP